MGALSALASGDVAIVATDTVYGLAALPGSQGYDRIFRIKGRPASQVLPWLVADSDALDRWGEDASGTAHAIAEELWPGALTLVVEASDEAKALGGTAADGSIALRCPDSPELRTLIAAVGSPVACTSANLHGHPAVSVLEELEDAFSGLAGRAQLPASCPGARSSTIVDCRGAGLRLLREGPISLADVRACAFGDTLHQQSVQRRNRGMDRKRIALASDHGGFEQKGKLRSWLEAQGHEVVDFGCFGTESVDYPDYASAVAHAVADGKADLGVLVCGTGIGMQIAANKVRGVRAANVTSPEFAALSREHNNANVVTLSGRFVALEENQRILEAFIGTDFAGGRHERRVAKIADMEQEG